jgi:PleD family two-component response regulator
MIPIAMMRPSIRYVPPRRRARAGGDALQVFAAAEGQTIKLSRDDAQAPNPAETMNSALRAPSTLVPQTVLIADADATIRQMLEATLKTEGADVLSVADGETAFRLACRERPALIFLDLHLAGYDGLTICRMLRRLDDPYFKTIPLVVLARPTRQKNALVKAFKAGATDYIVKTCKPALLHARACAWLLRTYAEK